MLYAGVISARLVVPLRSACIRVFDRRACPMPFACAPGLTKSCDKNQNFSVIQLKPKPTIVSPCSATQSPVGSSARQNFGNAIGGGAGHGRLPWRFEAAPHYVAKHNLHCLDREWVIKKEHVRLCSALPPNKAPGFLACSPSGR